jgi:SAM-dependent methyltransferase
MMGVSRGVVPVPLYEGYFGFMAARAIMAGWSLGVFTALNMRPERAASLANRLGLDVDGTEALLKVLEAMEYVESDSDNTYRPSASTKKWLLAESPSSFGWMIGGVGYYVWKAWSSLEAGLRSGESVLDRHERPPDDPFWDTYLRSVYEQARWVSSEITEVLDIPAPQRMLDVAGGHGAYSGALCSRYPGLHATVVDLEGSARAGKKIAEENGYAERITWQVGDIFTANLDNDFDLALISAFIHYLKPAKCVELLKIIHDSLRPGATIAISDAAFDQEASPDQFDALIALDYILASGHRPHYVSEVIAFLKEAGYTDVHQHPKVTWRMLALGRA